MDDQNTDSDSHSVASNHSTSSSSSKNKQGSSYNKDASARSLQNQTKRKQEDDLKVGSTPKRKKTDSTDPLSIGSVTPGSTGTRKAAPLSERQQMAIALAMSAQESGGTSPVQTPPQPSMTMDTTPRSAMSRRVNRRNEKGESPLHLATIKGDVEHMTQLVEAGAGVNVPDYAGWTALHEACNHGFVNAAKLLLEKGANVNAQGLDNDTPLHDAASNGHPELVSLLLRYGANPYQDNRKGESPLDVALNDDIKQLLRKEATVVANRFERAAQHPVQIRAGKDNSMSMTPSEHSQKVANMLRHEPFIGHVTDRSHVPPMLVSSAGQATAETSLLSSATADGGDSAPFSPSSTGSRPASRHSSTGFLQEGSTDRTDVLSVPMPDTHPSANPAMRSSSADPGNTGRPAPAPQSLCEAASLESQGKPARQSLNFTPIKIPQVDSVAKGKSATREQTGLMAVSNCTTETSQAEPSLTLAGSKDSKQADHVATKPCANELIPVKPDLADKDTAEDKGMAEGAGTVSTDTTTELAEKNKTAQKAEQEIRNPLPPSAENKVLEEVKSESKVLPVSPTPERAPRTRTGSMHRKKRQAQSHLHTESPVQPEGDNSKDSTDSHSSISNVTRASRSRNKQQAMIHQEDEPIPARETRRKTMMKERSAASSPSLDKSSKVGSQKVPPLTIKLGGKSQTCSSTSTAKDTHSSVASATAGGEPYVMLADKDTERANSILAKEQAKSPDNLDSAETKEKKQDATTATSQAGAQPPLATTGVSTRRTGLRSHTNRTQAPVGEKLRDPVPPKKSRRMKAEPAAVTPAPPPSLPPPPGPSTIFNPYTLFKGVREQMHKKWEKIGPVNPRTPAGYSRYIINTKKYLLHKNAATNANKLAIPLLSAPAQLTQPMKELFNKQEQERYKLSHQHLIEGEKLRIAYEQEVVRVHTRGARAAANQEVPLSVCTVLKDKESGTVYHPFNALKDGSSCAHTTEEKSCEKNSRSHFNNRQLISWHQDIKDKFERLKDQMLSRHHHEAESLYAVQTMDWEWKLKEVGLCDYKAQPTIEMLHVPMVPVNDDADILNS